MPTPTLPTELGVINQALTALGEDVLQNTTGDEPRAIVMRQHYEPVKYFCFAMSNWRFATAKVALSKLTAAPANRWSTAWQLPNDRIKLLYTWPPSDYEIQGDQLWSNNSSAVTLDYIRLLDEPLWPAWFTRLVVAELVLRTCKGITGDDPTSAMGAEQEAALNQAYFQDAQQQPNQTALPNDFIDCRF